MKIRYMRFYLFIFPLVLVTAACQPLNPAPVPAPSPATQVLQQSAPAIQLYFPQFGSDPAPALVNLFNSATDNIDIAIYALTNPDIVKSIGDAYKRGVKVRVITDGDQSRNTSQKHAINDLLTIGIPVKVNSHQGSMHLKMSIIDGRTVTLGSYNYTSNASKENDEVLIVVTQAETVSRCRDEFNRLWSSPEFSRAKMSY